MPCSGGQVALTFTTGGASTQNATQLPRTHGWGFLLNQSIIVDALGMYDIDGDGLLTETTVGLWTDSGVLISSTVIPSGASAPLTSGFRFQSITPIQLTSGQAYVLGATLKNDGDRARFGVSDLVVAPEFTYSGTRVSSPGSGFAFPEPLPAVARGTFGPNLMFTVIPEPSTIMFAVLAFVTQSLRRRKSVPHNRV
jgi:hypothetical protein